MADNLFQINKGVRLIPQSGAPASPQNGAIYYDDSLGKFRKYENGAWADLGGNGSAAILYAHAVITTSLADVGGTAANAYSATATTLTKSSNGAFPSAVAITATSNGTDDVTLALNSYVLLVNEATAANNGLWQITDAGSGGTPWILTRSTSLNSAAAFSIGVVVAILGGTWYTNTLWVNKTTVATLGSSSITIERFGALDPINYPAAASESISASGTIIINTKFRGHQLIKVAGNGVAVTTSTTPFGSIAPENGTRITVMGTDDDNTVTIPFTDTAKGTMQSGDRELGKNESITYVYESQSDRYIEIGTNQ